MNLEVIDYFNKLLKNNNLSHAFLIEVDDTYDTVFSTKIVKKIISSENLNKAEYDLICSSIDKNECNDLKIIRPDGKYIKKEQLRDLMAEFKNKSLICNRRFYIIEYAENLNSSSANAILKFLEEPDNDIIAILITKNIQNVLETIISRCQLISFNKYISFNYDAETFNNASIYIELLEEKKEKAIAYVSDLYSMKAEELRTVFNIWLNIYSDVIKILSSSLSKSDLQYDISKILKNVDNKTILKKIECIQEMLRLLDFNVNSRFILDKLFVGGD